MNAKILLGALVFAITACGGKKGSSNNSNAGCGVYGCGGVGLTGGVGGIGGYGANGRWSNKAYSPQLGWVELTVRIGQNQNLGVVPMVMPVNGAFPGFGQPLMIAMRVRVQSTGMVYQGSNMIAPNASTAQVLTQVGPVNLNFGFAGGNPSAFAVTLTGAISIPQTVLESMYRPGVPTVPGNSGQVVVIPVGGNNVSRQLIW